jgi:hypothetical protein
VAGVGLQVVKGLCLGVGDSDRFGDTAVDGFFESFPGFAKRDVLELDGCVFGVLPPCLSRVSGLGMFGVSASWGSIPGSGSYRATRISKRWGSE